MIIGVDVLQWINLHWLDSRAQYIGWSYFDTYFESQSVENYMLQKQY